MGLLKYWFRGVEKFAPWVNRIHFVTCGHVPEWLNTDHEKLHIVKHSDYIDSAYLPTFNSNAIELSMHKIEGLSEHFVYFNDDTFLTAPVKETHFFRNNLPCDYYEMKAIVSYFNPDSIDYIRMNNTGMINRNYSGRKKKLKYFKKKFSCCYDKKTLIRNTVSFFWRDYLGFRDPHLPIPYQKSDFVRLWEKEKFDMEQTISHKFRTPYDVNHWIFRYARMVEGQFTPVNYEKFAKYILLKNDFHEVCHDIVKNNYKILCINDNEKVIEFDSMKKEFNQLFLSILPDKSNYEICT